MSNENSIVTADAFKNISQFVEDMVAPKKDKDTEKMILRTKAPIEKLRRLIQYPSLEEDTMLAVGIIGYMACELWVLADGDVIFVIAQNIDGKWDEIGKVDIQFDIDYLRSKYALKGIMKRLLVGYLLGDVEVKEGE